MAMCANGLAKLIEECGELQQVAAKKLAYFDTDNHPDGSNLRIRLEEEIADVLAACDFVTLTFQLSNRIAMPLSELVAPMAETIQERRQRKLALFLHWHAQTDNDQGFIASPNQEPSQ